MLAVKCRDGSEMNYYSLHEAARMVTENKWGLKVDGIHSESLRRQWRECGVRWGKRIGRDVFFSAHDMTALGYEIEEDTDRFVNLGDVVELIPDHTEEQTQTGR